MIHLNGSVLCAIDIETTGLDFTRHEIYDITILPLDHRMEIRRDILPFSLMMKPDLDENIDWDGMNKCGNKERVVKAQQSGLDKFRAIDLLLAWKDKLKMPENKQIMVLSHNWAGIDKQFLQQWLGPLTFNLIFDGRYRDLMCTTLYLNDRAEYHKEQIPFPKQNLTYICSCLKIPYEVKHTSMEDAKLLVEAYREIVRGYQLMEPGITVE